VRTLPFLVALLALLAPLTVASDGSAEGTIRILVLVEHGTGTASQAQPHVDKIVAIAAKANGWSDASGQFMARRKTAEKYIKSHTPEFGIMSLSAFLALREKHNLEVVGEAEVKTAGGRQYHLISKDASDLDGCKGAKLATNHADDNKRFINKVVSGGDFNLDDFKVVKTKRPVQTIKYVIDGKATCALIDDAQFAELSHIDGSDGISSVWKSKTLPPMAIVAFSSATDAERAKFKSTLSGICSGDGKESCEKVGIKSLNPADSSSYTDVISAYGAD
jgi:hypothetical protein